MDKLEWKIWAHRKEPESIIDFIWKVLEPYRNSEVYEDMQTLWIEEYRQKFPDAVGSWDTDTIFFVGERAASLPEHVKAVPADMIAAAHGLLETLPQGHPLLPDSSRTALPKEEPKQISPEDEERGTRQSMALDMYYEDKGAPLRTIAHSVVMARAPDLKENDPDQYKREVERLRSHLNRTIPR